MDALVVGIGTRGLITGAENSSSKKTQTSTFFS